MDAALVVIAVLGTVLLAVSIYMEWVGLMNIFLPRRASRYDGCGHLRMVPSVHQEDRCWTCRHPHLTVQVHAPRHGH